MTEVDHSLPGSMTEAEAKQKIKEFIDGRQEALYEAVEGMIAAAVENVVRYGGVVALKAANQQFICAQDGGPSDPNEVFEFQSRTSVGPHESYEVVRP